MAETEITKADAELLSALLYKYGVALVLAKVADHVAFGGDAKNAQVWNDIRERVFRIAQQVATLQAREEE